MLKNIIIVTESFYVGGGASEVALKTVRLLASLNEFKIFLVASGSIPKNDKRISNVTYLHLPAIKQNENRNFISGFINKLYNFDVKRTFLSYLKNFSPKETIVHVHNWPIFSYSLFSALLKWNGKFCVTMHDYYSVCPSTNFYDYKQWKICTKKPGSLSCFCTNCDRRNGLYKINQNIRFIFQKYFFHFHEKIENIIFVSDFSRKVIEPFFTRKKNVATVNNPISFADYSPQKRNDKYLFVGRLSKEKGAELFCRAISELGLKGIVAGSGDELDTLKAKYPSIEFLGWCNREAVQKLYQQCRAFVFPTLLYETAGLSVLEALSYGMACIVPNKAAASHYVENLKTAIFFESGNVESLKNSVLKMENEETRLFLEEKIKERFNYADYSDMTYLNKIISYYNKILC